jgi:adenylosuccinate synthase
MTNVCAVGLGWGDEGKGSVTDLLTRQMSSPLTVRFNGGCQAAHNVLLPDGRHHTFSQFGSGTFAGARTFLSRFTLVDPLRMAAEADHLSSLGVIRPYRLMTVDSRALLVTPYHAAMNKAREKERGAKRHGSCGVGIGEAVSYSLKWGELAPRIGDCRDPWSLRIKLAHLRKEAILEFPHLSDILSAGDLISVYETFCRTVEIVDSDWLLPFLRKGDVVFEGAQGVLLDEFWGDDPYTTWSTTTFDNAIELSQNTSVVKIGVVRSYMTRHGPGPFPTEDPSLKVTELHNTEGEWQGPWRVGHFDAPRHSYAIKACGGIDTLAVTHLDQVTDQFRMRVGESDDKSSVYISAGDERWEDLIADALDTPVSIVSYGPTYVDKKVLSPLAL